MQIQRSSLHRMMEKEGYKAFKAGVINELSDSDMISEEMHVHALPTESSRRRVMFTDESDIYSSMRM